jgi:hypothetical protein
MGTPFGASGEKVSVVVLEGGELWEVVRSLRIICAGFCAVKMKKTVQEIVRG